TRSPGDQRYLFLPRIEPLNLFEVLNLPMDAAKMSPFRNRQSLFALMLLLRSRRKWQAAVLLIIVVTVAVVLISILSSCTATGNSDDAVRTERLSSFERLAMTMDGTTGASPGAATLSSATGGASGRGQSDDGELQAAPLVVRHPDGSFTLNSFLPMHLINHLQNMMASEQWEVIDEQLVSEATKVRYRSRGKDPQEVIDFLKENRVAILQMLARMPYGINSPAVTYNQAGDVIIIRLYGGAAHDLDFTHLETIRENGEYHLLVIY
ncbi:MAG: hypothetical protein ACOC0P_02895, partial [Planctomycetota bacterium]